jgi:hypothetical protein
MKDAKQYDEDLYEIMKNSQPKVEEDLSNNTEEIDDDVLRVNVISKLNESTEDLLAYDEQAGTHEYN